MKRILFVLVLSCLSGASLFGQTNSQYSVRFIYDTLSCPTSIFTLDLEIKANEGFEKFYVSDQNYRFSFNDNVIINPRIVDELEVAGSNFSPEFTAFFDEHNLNGSLDTIVSYNVVLGGGSGYPIDDTRWYPVGRIAFDVLDASGCLELKWHTHAPEDFPPTFVGEKVGGPAGILYELAEGTYDNGFSDPFFCRLSCPLPIELASFEGFDKGCKTELKWTTFTETGNDYFLVKKSIDGIRWATIGKVQGAGTSTESKNYSLIDDKITGLTTYYALWQVDLDGTTTMSDQITVRSSCFNDEISIGITQLFPNPARDDDRVTLEFYTDLENQETELVVTDELGREVTRVAQVMQAGRNVISFKADILSSGVYFMQIKGDGWYSGVQKLVKINGE